MAMNCSRNQSDEKFVIETKFNEILTSNSCIVIVSEIIKYILYQKQQLPYTFERLKYVITKKRNLDQLKKEKNMIVTNSERHFKTAEDSFTTLEMLFEKTRQEMLRKEGVNEVVLLFGSTPLAPKQTYHIHLPKLYCNHPLTTLGDRKCLGKLLQSIVQCSQLNEMLLSPMSPTNMYVFIRKQKRIGSSVNLNSWFLPKNRYEIPPIGQHFHIKLSHPSYDGHTCACHRYTVFTDNSEESLNSLNTNGLLDVTKDCTSSEIETVWYQAGRIFKGFKDVYINGVSISNSWMR